ncbi:hypothetical protein [Clostridium beijerinckii]|nr:hypothetical protein [Clostridium beijerinckii]NSA87147.1 FMN phosphatase YigB (HAD superfamily) [Clostridium beijerinckii]
MKKKLAIFDLDGTLFDTKDVNFYRISTLWRSIIINWNMNIFANHVME